MSEVHEFDRIMKSFYRNRYEDVQKTNRFLWDHLTDLVSAIHSSESDGSGISDLKKKGEAVTDELRAMLERGVGI